MTRVAQYIDPRVWIFNLAALVLVSGCALNTEEEVQDIVAGWLSLEALAYFESKSDCTAAVFRVQDTVFSEAVTRTEDVRFGLQAIKSGATVAFAVPDMSPNEMSSRITSYDLPEGIGIISSGMGAKACMSEDLQRRFFAALSAPSSVMIFDTSSNALAVLRPEAKTLYFLRGAV
jgi:hypothetical protein